jgi:hypothetical protein
MNPPPFPYRQVGYREQALYYTLVLWQPIIIPNLRSYEYSGEYYHTPWRQFTVFLLQNGQWYHPQLLYRQVGNREQLSDYKFG